MSSISINDVKRLADLSAITVSDDEASALLSQLNEILGFVEQLNEVDTGGVEPTYQVTGLENVMREDEVIDYGLNREDLLKNTPDSQEGQIKVKRVLT